MAYWLMKSEPDVYSIDQLSRDRTAPWDGVRNYQARNHLRAMRAGDRALFYHSSVTPSAVVGEMEIVKEAYADPGQFDPRSPYYDSASKPESPRWSLVDVRFVRRFPRILTLQDIRRMPALQGMVLLHNSRLSVQPVTSKEWAVILRQVLLLLMLVVSIGSAECRYFRTAARFEKCRVVTLHLDPLSGGATEEDLLNAVPQDTPGFDDGRRAQISCFCEYSLSGSDPRCDFDHMEPAQALISTGDPQQVCASARKRCRELCPETLRR